jgi:hypothetical protein
MFPQDADDLCLDFIEYVGVATTGFGVLTSATPRA